MLQLALKELAAAKQKLDEASKNAEKASDAYQAAVTKVRAIKLDLDKAIAEQLSAAGVEIDSRVTISG